MPLYFYYDLGPISQNSSRKNLSLFCFLPFFSPPYIHVHTNASVIHVSTRPRHKLCRLAKKKHNQPHQLKQMHANTERNALHLQNKTACRGRRGRRGLRETGGDEFNPKRQITRSTLHCLSLELAPQSATHGERVCHPPSLRRARAHTGMQKRITAARYYKAHNHCEVRAAALRA